MKESKVVSSLREAIRLSGLQDGMCVSFHHHLRNGDYVVNMVMEQISAMGIRDLTVNASALFDVHLPMLEHIKNGTVSRLLTNYMSAGLGRAISGGVMDQPVEFRTHGGRPRDIAGGETPIDVAFIAAPSSDTMGNCTGKVGKSACGSLGYAFPDAQYAKKVIVITDELVPYPLCGWSIPEIYVDYVVAVDAIGDPAGIVSGTTRMTRNPVAITIAQTAARVIASSGLLKDGFSFQTGAGGASLATAMYLEKIMKQQGIHGSYAQGGITGLLVDMLNEGLFRALLDVPGDRYEYETNMLHPRKSLPLRSIGGAVRQPRLPERGGRLSGRRRARRDRDRHFVQYQRPHGLQRLHHGRQRRPQRRGCRQ